MFSLVAFIAGYLTLDGLFSATAAGTIVFGIGDWAAASVLIFFFVSSALITGRREDRSYEGVRRTGMQVWANGWSLVFFFIIAALLQAEVFIIGGLAALAVATADTWATELRSTDPNSTYLITSFEKVPPGTDGGISVKGTLWGIMGALIISMLAKYVFLLSFPVFLFIFIGGFFGCLVDSYFGATIQRNNMLVSIPLFNWQFYIDNNGVNAISTGIGAMLTIILKLLIA
nr:DUF92 domain-containing protein [Fodinibius salicampi]